MLRQSFASHLDQVPIHSQILECAQHFLLYLYRGIQQKSGKSHEDYLHLCVTVNAHVSGEEAKEHYPIDDHVLHVQLSCQTLTDPH